MKRRHVPMVKGLLKRLELFKAIQEKIKTSNLSMYATLEDVRELKSLYHQVFKGSNVLSARETKDHVLRMDFLLRRVGRICHNLTHDSFCQYVDGENVVVH